MISLHNLMVISLFMFLFEEPFRQFQSLSSLIHMVLKIWQHETIAQKPQIVEITPHPKVNTKSCQHIFLFFFKYSSCSYGGSLYFDTSDYLKLELQTKIYMIVSHPSHYTNYISSSMHLREILITPSKNIVIVISSTYKL